MSPEKRDQAPTPRKDLASSAPDDRFSVDDLPAPKTLPTKRRPGRPRKELPPPDPAPVVPGQVDHIKNSTELFLLDCKARNLAKATLHNYSYPLEQLTEFLNKQGIMRVQDITADHLRTFIAMQYQDHNAGGVMWYYRVIKTFMLFLADEGDVSEQVIKRVKSPKMPKTILPPVEIETVQQMLLACDGDFADRDRAILLCLLDSGLRAAEMLALDRSDVEISTGRILVRHGKGDKTRVAFLGAQARKSILRMLQNRGDDCEALWIQRNNARLTYNGLRQILRRRAADAHVEEPSAHDFRRAFALLSLRGGCDIYSLQKMMGHSDLSVLQRYLSQTEEDLKTAHDRTSPVDNMPKMRPKAKK